MIFLGINGVDGINGINGGGVIFGINGINGVDGINGGGRLRPPWGCPFGVGGMVVFLQLGIRYD